MSDEQKIIQQEQKILDKLIYKMDSALLKMNQGLKRCDLEIKRAKASCLPEAYGALVTAQKGKAEGKERIKTFGLSRDILYRTRIEVECTDGRGTTKEDIKIGLHSFVYGPEVFIVSWVLPVSRHYIMDNADPMFEGVVEDRDGNKYFTKYKLLRKRVVSMDFDKITEAVSMYPLVDEETEQIIADEFLQELLKRRSETEFKNIVFTIQKQQGEIIQSPFKHNMIVQGCAGSGKSMIMLHRLPIVLYDNPKTLNRSNLYIITPSLAYIQMANNMREELEIEDLDMGTLNQYYDRVISLYGVSPSAYGRMRGYAPLSQNVIKYVYSQDFKQSVREQLYEMIRSHRLDYSNWARKLGITTIKRNVKDSYKEQIRTEILNAQKFVNEMYSAEREYLPVLRDVVSRLYDFVDFLLNRRQEVLMNIQKEISSNQSEIEKLQIDIRDISEDQEPDLYAEFKNEIERISDHINYLYDFRESVVENEDYFNDLRDYANDEIVTVLKEFEGYDKQPSNISLRENYNMYNHKHDLCVLYDYTVDIFSDYEDIYSDYADDIFNRLMRIENFVINLKKYRRPWIEYEDSKAIGESITYYNELLTSIVDKVYLKQMQKLGVEPDKNGKISAITCSPYMYLQILYQFQGIHAKRKESLITIDEAQNLMPEEVKLIRAVNDDKVVLNLFGDVKQHIEGSKGVDNWNDFTRIIPFKKYEMRENYRNARQITEFCNKSFHLDMRAINLDGKGVHVITDDFDASFRALFMKPQSPGLSSIIVKDREEAERLLKLYPQFGSRIQKLALEPQAIHPNRWNLLTVEQAKGLEFETVFVISGRMTKNEKYIAYTRALDELYVYESELALSIGAKKSGTNIVEKPEEKTSGTRRKRVKRYS